MSEIDVPRLIYSLIREKGPSNQSELQSLMAAQGVAMTQSGISRVLNKAGIRKISGQYRIPAIAPGEAEKVEFLNVMRSGETMLVIKTPIGSASRLAYIIDNAGIGGIAGTISGDDTIFVALTEKGLSTTVSGQIISLFREE